MNLTKCRIKDLGIILTGNTPPTSQRKYYGNLYPLIKPTDMKIDERYIGYTQESLSEEGYKLFEKKILPRNTSCVVTIGTIGKLCLTKEPSFCNQAVNSIIVDQKFHDPMYIFYLMKTTVPTVKFLSSGTASGRENVSKSAFESIELEVPALSIQQKIASILSSYDDLIENNTRRIEILEQMAKLIYEEWFVKFRFPGHENVKMVPSDLGEIPEGWEVKAFSEVIDVNPSRKLSKGKLATKVNMADLNTWQSWINSSQKEEYKSGPKFKNGDTLFARITPSLENGKTAFVNFLNEGEIAFGSTEFIVLGSKVIESGPYIFCLSRSEYVRETAITAMTGTSGRQRVPNDCFNHLLICVPPTNIVRRFNEIVVPMFEMIKNNSIKSSCLKKTRDLLLPKLISGEIDVSDLDIRIRNEFQKQ